MRAALLYNYTEPFKVESVELEEPQQGEVVVKLAASGVCHSDLSIQRGLIPLPTPIIIGHEGAGVVEAVGSGGDDGSERRSCHPHLALQLRALP